MRIAFIAIIAAGACALLSACETIGIDMSDEQKAALQADAKQLASDAAPVVKQAAEDAVAKFKEDAAK
jgi:hypothetical protein